MRFLARSLTGLFLLVVTLAILGGAAILVGNAMRAGLAAGGPPRPAEERIVAANVVTLTPSTLTPTITAYGKVAATRRLDIRSALSGTVVWVAEAFRNGGTVAEGALLLRLDPVPAREALALARATLTEAQAAAVEALGAVELSTEDLAAAEAQVQLLRQALQRQEDIAARGAGSSQAVETAALSVSSAEQGVLSRKQALASARARVDQTAVAVTRAEVALAEAGRALDDTELRAGIGGRVDGVGLVEGAMIAANETLGQIIDPASLDVALRLSTAQYARLLDATGALVASEISVMLPGLAKAAPLRGRLDRVDPEVDAGQTGRLVIARLDPGAGDSALLQPGDFVEVAIPAAALTDAALVPATAVGRQDTVLVLGPDDRLEEVPVQVLGRQGDAVILEPVARDWAWLDSLIRPLDADFAAAAAETLPDQERPELDFFG